MQKQIKNISTKHPDRLSVAEGFTLLEILVVLTIVAFLALAVSGIPRAVKDRDPECFESTIESMEQIRSAILGSSGSYIEGERRFSGYVTDLGELPELLGGYSQPVGLWTDMLKKYGTENLPEWGYTGEISRTWMGWNGPYIECPSGILTDGWGYPVHFERFDLKEGKEKIDPDGANVKIKSYGANGTEDEEDTGYDEDIEIKIYYNEYMGAVAGYAGRDVTDVKIYYPERGVEKFQVATPDSDRYFRFEKEAAGNRDIPFGIRSIKVTKGSGKIYIFTVEPTINWVGTLE